MEIFINAVEAHIRTLLKNNPRLLKEISEIYSIINLSVQNGEYETKVQLSYEAKQIFIAMGYEVTKFWSDEHQIELSVISWEKFPLVESVLKTDRILEKFEDIVG